LEVVVVQLRHPRRNGLEVVSEVVGAVTLGALAVLMLSALPALRRYIPLKRL
jgi:hypothetical protein